MSAALKAHEKSNYVIKVVGSEKVYGCTVEYPPNHLHGVSFGKYFYNIVDDGLLVYHGNSEEKINLPDYARRTYILADILIKSKLIKASTKLIVYYDSKGQRKKDLIGAIGGGRLTAKERKLNNALAEIIIGKLSGNYADIKPAISSLSKLFEKGGV